jgi:hypothetical protein
MTDARDNDVNPIVATALATCLLAALGASYLVLGHGVLQLVRADVMRVAALSLMR